MEPAGRPNNSLKRDWGSCRVHCMMAYSPPAMSSPRPGCGRNTAITLLGRVRL